MVTTMRPFVWVRGRCFPRGIGFPHLIANFFDRPGRLKANRYVLDVGPLFFDDGLLGT